MALGVSSFNPYAVQAITNRYGPATLGYQYSNNPLQRTADSNNFHSAYLQALLNGPSGRQAARQVLADYTAVHQGGNSGGLLSRIGHQLSVQGKMTRRAVAGRNARLHVWPVAAGAIGGGYATGALGGAEGGGSALGAGAATGEGGFGGTAATVDPFAADLGSGAGWTSLGEGAGTVGGVAATQGGGADVASGGFYDPSGTFHAGVPAGDFGTVGGAASSGGSWLSSPLGQMLVKAGVGGLLNKFSGHPENALRNLSTAPYESSDIQRYLPPELREGNIGPTLQAGIQNIGELIRNPGGLNPNVADAIRARLASESSNIAQSYQGIASNQAGAAARSNLPVSIKTALQSALDIAQERAQRGARGAALTESEQLRREDVQKTMAILDAVLQFIQSGRGGAIPGLSQAANMSNQRQAANLAFIGSLFSGQAA